MTRDRRRNAHTAFFLIAGLAATACSSDPVETTVEPSFQVQFPSATDAALVMTQNVVPSEAMDAWFEGLVVADDTGCIRLEDGEGPTVVWPRDYMGEVAAEGFAILDANGTEVGKIGESFGVGGGEVPELLATLGFSEADRELAEELCPGNYWIVAP